MGCGGSATKVSIKAIEEPITSVVPNAVDVKSPASVNTESKAIVLPSALPQSEVSTEDALSSTASSAAPTCKIGTIDDSSADLAGTPTTNTAACRSVRELRTNTDQDPSLGSELRSVSVHHLEVDFIGAVVAAGLDCNATVRDAEPLVIRPRGADVLCPRDGRPSAAYVDAVAGQEHVGMGTHMLSYSWGYLVRDIIDSLANHCINKKLQTKSTYVWMCCLCINQHRVKEREAKGETVHFSEFESTFGSRVRSLGRVLAVFTRWDHPTYVSRVWCVYELYVAITTPEVEFDIILPRNQRAAFFACLGDAGADPLWDTLSGLRVQDARATIEDDRQRILAIVSASPGYAELNNAVRTRIQNWFVQTASTSLRLMLADTTVSTERAKEITRISNNVAQYKEDLGLHAEAQELLQLTLQFCKTTSIEDSACFANILNSLAVAMEAQGSVDEALELFAQVVTHDAKRGSSETGEVATTLNNRAAALETQGNIEEAIELYDRVLAMQAETCGEETDAYATTLGNKAHAIESLGEVDEAIMLYNRALAIQSKTINKESPRFAQTLNNYAHALKATGEFARSIELYRQALAIRAATVGEDSSDYTDTLWNLAIAVKAQGDSEEAIKLYEQLLPLLGASSLDVASVLAGLASLKRDRGDAKGAAEMYERALNMHAFEAGRASPDYIVWAFNFGQVLESLEDFRAALTWYEAADSAERACGQHDPVTVDAIARVRAKCSA